MTTTEAVVPNAGETVGKWHGALSETINVPVDKAWAIAGNFCGLGKWLKTIDSCETIAGEPQKPGCIRYLIGNSFPRPDGSKSWAKEQLLSIDESNYHFSYAMLDNNFGFEGYTNDFKLRDLGDGTTHVDWAFSLNPVEGRTEEKVAEYMTGVFRKSLSILVDLVHTPSNNLSRAPGCQYFEVFETKRSIDCTALKGEIPRMASDEAQVVTHAQQLLDFDWKLKYVVSSASLASVNRPLLRLELAVTTPPVKVETVPYFRKEGVEEKPRIAVAEYSKVELDKLISDMEAISQALDSMESSD